MTFKTPAELVRAIRTADANGKLVLTDLECADMLEDQLDLRFVRGQLDQIKAMEGKIRAITARAML